MLTRGWRARLALLAALGVVWLAASPGPASAAVRPGGRGLAGSAAADGIRDNQQWVLDMLDVRAAWRVAAGRGITVAVIDSGVNPGVSDLAGSVLTGPDYTSVGTSPSSGEWGMHGTWMASLIAGHGHAGGGSGVVGVAPESRILSIRVIPDRDDPHYRQYEHEGAPLIQRSLADGIGYAVAHGAQVISMSIGYSAPSRAVRQALLTAYQHGVVVVASAGNSGDQPGSGGAGEAPASFPADYPRVISVAAVDSSGDVAGFSSDNLSVQVAAPGVSVPAQGRDGQYWWVSGTSPACALVAGVAALIKSGYPDLAPNLVADALTTTTTHRPAGGYDSRVGFGIVNAAAALAAAGKLGRGQAGQASLAATARYRGWPAAEPVGPRSSGRLVLFSLFALLSLALAAAAAIRLAVLGRANR